MRSDFVGYRRLLVDPQMRYCEYYHHQRRHLLVDTGSEPECGVWCYIVFFESRPKKNSGLDTTSVDGFSTIKIDHL